MESNGQTRPSPLLRRAFQTDRRQFNLLPLEKKKGSLWSDTHLPVTKWNLIFSFEEKLLTDPPLTLEAKHRTFLKLIEMLFYGGGSCIRRA